MSAPRILTCDEVRDLAPLFVLDALDPVEMAAVREHLATCTEAHEELVELGPGRRPGCGAGRRASGRARRRAGESGGRIPSVIGVRHLD